MESSTTDTRTLSESIAEESAFVDDINKELSKVIVGQQHMVNSLLTGLLTNGHILLEGVPGLAKTLAIKSLAEALDGTYSRLQFTPDLLPSDLIGTQVYNVQDHSFSTRKGPVFANFVLADEINRAPAKVQSALLEAMQEKQVTIADETFALPKPFLVMATQNPVEQEGTYPLPEAQVDRFMLKVLIDYPELEDERLIIRQNLSKERAKINPVVSLDQIQNARERVQNVQLSEKMEEYVLNLIFATREPDNFKLRKLKPLIRFGASPRGSINLASAAKAHAFLSKRAYVTPEDVRAMALPVLRHRIGLSYEAEAEGYRPDDVVVELINGIAIP
ncbi:MAG: MoxR family ATPase [Bacteroidetes bacterium]|uniref:MoxR family ATPase n=1 Tax=Phaeocystidibacter marisrubri TaxID=1577780 RepID=A0A6L3ZEL3_9FLAO|nr:MoxR family ATPase [Phaeocystidibacter marisrubri]KAB2816275.1 MoxR family ATPase [Phaeocystidibacter marisrubri]TNE27947.1 MAG: MoxR family ATPase [Bacteroidota bacterium]GGH68208.1 ATPase AAA [Phaeocystidibacter marisrubri]